jgi:HAE1 family hydrophobic/amphiphilic exporter-1
MRRAEGHDRITAMRLAARERFRPIIMTTVAMVAGMTPLALDLDPGAQAAASLGTVVIGGLVSSLLLTLVLVPVVYVALAGEFARAPEPLPRSGHDPVGELSLRA